MHRASMPSGRHRPSRYRYAGSSRGSGLVRVRVWVRVWDRARQGQGHGYTVSVRAMVRVVIGYAARAWLGGRLSLSMGALASAPHMHIMPRPQQMSASSTS